MSTGHAPLCGSFVLIIGYSANDPLELGKDPIVAIAIHLNLDTVYHASGREDEIVETIQFKPIHELISIMKGL